jgi:hypothetical protein
MRALFCTVILAGVSVLSMPAADEPTVVASLRVDDGRWLVRTLGRIAAASGADERLVRAEAARRCYLSRSLDGIDLARPALIERRTGRLPLQAVIPVGNRAAFLDAFGALPDGEPPLVRVGDRDGTVVYTQTHPDGLREYRLLVTDGLACFAPTAAICRTLAADQSLRQNIAGPAVTWTVAGDALLPLGADLCGGLQGLLPGWQILETGWGMGQPLPLQGTGFGLLADVARHAATVRVTVAGDDAAVALRCRIEPRSGSPLAAWTVSQHGPGIRNAATTPTLPAPGGHHLLAAHWSLHWSGAITAAIPAMSAAIEQDEARIRISQIATILDGSPAGGLVVIGGTKPTRLQGLCVAETPRAAELGQAQADFLRSQRPMPMTETTVGGFEAVQVRMPTILPDGQPGTVEGILVSADRHLVSGSGLGDILPAAASATADIGLPAADEAPSLAQIAIDATALARQVLGGSESDLELPETRWTARLTLAASGDALDIACDLPLFDQAQIAGIVEAELRAQVRANPRGSAGPRPRR